jgi:hypothetical protein
MRMDYEKNKIRFQNSGFIKEENEILLLNASKILASLLVKTVLVRPRFDFSYMGILR